MEFCSCCFKWEGCGRIRTELVLLRHRWHIILLGLLFQYVHGIFTQLAYRNHTPAPKPLHDFGFVLLPELRPEARWISEAIFTVVFLAFISWSFTPLLAQRSFSTVILWTRLLTVLVVCQVLRILSFSSTQLPGPALHCRSAASTATRPWVNHWWQHLVVDVGRQVSHSCGDLIFSSHMTFILTGILAYNHYGSKVAVKVASWVAGAVLALLIIAARKHYTVDIVVAWYVVPMVYTLLHVYWAQQNSGTSSNSSTQTFSCSGHSNGRLALEKRGSLEAGEVLAFAAGAGHGLPCCCSCQSGTSTSGSGGSKGAAGAALLSPAAAAEVAQARMGHCKMWWFSGRRGRQGSVRGCCFWCQQRQRLLAQNDVEAQALVEMA